MDRDERDEALARLGAATEGIAPDDRFTDAILSAARSTQPSIDDALSSLARATAEMEPDPAITSAIVARARSAPSWMDGVARRAPVALVAAAIAAAASLALFLSSTGDLDATIATAVDLVEVSE